MSRWQDAEAQPLWKRLAWMIVIWAASVSVVGTVAAALHFWIG